MKQMTGPTLIMSGDEEEPSLEVSLLMKRCIPKAGLAVFQKSGHAINLEEPGLFNRLLEDFFHQVEAGRWGARDPRTTIPSIYGPAGRPSACWSTSAAPSAGSPSTSRRRRTRS